MTKVELNTVELETGETLGYRYRQGGERVLLLIHGNMTSSRHWDVLIEALDPGYTVYAVDLRGFGISTYNQPIRDLDDFAEDVRLFMEKLGIPPCSVVGWSTGGGVAMLLAAKYPRLVEKLILLCSLSTRGYPMYQLDAQGQPVKRFQTREEIAQDTVRTQPILNAYARKDGTFLKALWESVIYTRKLPEPERYEEYVADMCTQRNLVEIYDANNRFNISHEHNGLAAGSGLVSRIEAPVLILRGEHDLVVTEQMSLEVKEDFGERAQYVVLTGCGHSPLIDDLEQLVRRIESFVQ
jgi:pimeloyl-ACP methyl ester carboxylesterase